MSKCVRVYSKRQTVVQKLRKEGEKKIRPRSSLHQHTERKLEQI